MHALLSPQPTSRPTGEALENHPFFFALESGFDTIAECALTPSLAHAELLAELDDASALDFERAMRGGDDADFFCLPTNMNLASPGPPGLDTPGRAAPGGYGRRGGGGGAAAGAVRHDRAQSAPAELSTPPRRHSDSRPATSVNRRSPAAWPRPSLIFWKRSRSSTITLERRTAPAPAAW